MRRQYAQLLERKGHVLEDRHVRPDRVALEDHAHAAALRWHEEPRGAGGKRPVAQGDLAPIGSLEPGHESEGGGLAAAARAEQRQELAGLRFEREVVDRDHRAERLHEARRSHGSHGRVLARNPTTSRTSRQAQKSSDG
jgi:hypothetical protein